MKTPNLAVEIGPLRLENPVLLASGTCGYGAELADLVDLDAVGGIVAKGISLEPMPGNPPPRTVETPCGLLNAIGLENVGLQAFLDEKLPRLRRFRARVIVNILGSRPEDYAALAERLDGAGGVDAVEVNISCPNVKAGGAAFGTDPAAAAAVTRAVRRVTRLPVIVKLSPNVTDVTEIARAVEAAGADAVSLINTLLGMAVDLEARRPALSTVFGGLSGPAVKPVALRMVWQVSRAVGIPVIGIGGIASARDALEFLVAGAAAVQVGTATLVRPGTAVEVIRGIRDYLAARGLSAPADLRCP
ncbi:dihydroorotate dehydrogenase [Dissulfurirhabdus thermomarina]|uniref:Dihydroorotate dehydrogenase n=1 Tax=Dissulfurirhabdus thermomarina TaxID=1765737 RepID=A0A6N9TPV3_DISTH|nr:dihydroorotate dehydrogenase [Dissulfurirhabdus thermomarina]NDY42470.1 dihydroorotate dehydrogenase [Dissulfurirhabdus thermomarina]NMX23365.1 dihydroorotate dehydrogenase [Dissulfurirhabdus thermomarina]